MISSDLPEALGISDRVLVVRNGRIAKEISRAEATEQNVMMYATGVAADERRIEEERTETPKAGEKQQ